MSSAPGGGSTTLRVPSSSILKICINAAESGMGRCSAERLPFPCPVLLALTEFEG